MQAVISPHIPEDKSPHRIGRRTRPSRLVGKSLTFIWVAVEDVLSVITPPWERLQSAT